MSGISQSDEPRGAFAVVGLYPTPTRGLLTHMRSLDASIIISRMVRFNRFVTAVLLSQLPVSRPPHYPSTPLCKGPTAKAGENDAA